LEKLFGDGDPLLSLSPDPYNFDTQRRSTWLKRLQQSKKQFIVPNIMSARMGKRLDGIAEGARTLQNTGERRFLIVEFDLAETKAGKDTRDAGFIRAMKRKGHSVTDINATLLAHLATKGPLVMVVNSGGKSLHGWFRTEGVPELQVRNFFNYACRLGADPQLWTKCQPVRLPEGVRENGNRQPVIFFNPKQLL
jgi:hypothetical protein